MQQTRNKCSWTSFKSSGVFDYNEQIARYYVLFLFILLCCSVLTNLASLQGICMRISHNLLTPYKPHHSYRVWDCMGLTEFHISRL